MINIFRKLQSLPSSRTVKVLSSWGSKDLKTPYQISQDNYQICSRHLWNVTDIYQIFPIAHLRPRLVSLNMTCFPGVKFVLGNLVFENVWHCVFCIFIFVFCDIYQHPQTPIVPSYSYRLSRRFGFLSFVPLRSEHSSKLVSILILHHLLSLLFPNSIELNIVHFKATFLSKSHSYQL